VIIQPTDTATDATERTFQALATIVRSHSHTHEATWTEAASVIWELPPTRRQPTTTADELTTDEAVPAAAQQALAGFSELIGGCRSAVDAIRYGEAAGRLRDAVLFDYGRIR